MQWSARCRALPLSPVDVTGWHTWKHRSLPLMRTVATRNDMKRAPLFTGANFFHTTVFFLSRSASFLAARANRTPGCCFNVIIHTTSPSCLRIFRLMRHRRTHSPRLKKLGFEADATKMKKQFNRMRQLANQTVGRQVQISSFYSVLPSHGWARAALSWFGMLLCYVVKAVAALNKSVRFNNNSNYLKGKLSSLLYIIYLDYVIVWLQTIDCIKTATNSTFCYFWFDYWLLDCYTVRLCCGLVTM